MSFKLIKMSTISNKRQKIKNKQKKNSMTRSTCLSSHHPSWLYYAIMAHRAKCSCTLWQFRRPGHPSHTNNTHNHNEVQSLKASAPWMAFNSFGGSRFLCHQFLWPLDFLGSLTCKGSKINCMWLAYKNEDSF